MPASGGFRTVTEKGYEVFYKTQKWLGVLHERFNRKIKSFDFCSKELRRAGNRISVQFVNSVQLKKKKNHNQISPNPQKTQ